MEEILDQEITCKVKEFCSLISKKFAEMLQNRRWQRKLHVSPYMDIICFLNIILKSTELENNILSLPTFPTQKKKMKFSFILFTPFYAKKKYLHVQLNLQ